MSIQASWNRMVGSTAAVAGSYRYHKYKQMQLEKNEMMKERYGLLNDRTRAETENLQAGTNLTNMRRAVLAKKNGFNANALTSEDGAALAQQAAREADAAPENSLAASIEALNARQTEDDLPSPHELGFSDDEIEAAMRQIGGNV